MDAVIEDSQPTPNIDCEEAEFECLGTHEVGLALLSFYCQYQVERVLNESVAFLSEKARITPSLSRMLLHAHEWDANKVSQLVFFSPKPIHLP